MKPCKHEDDESCSYVELRKEDPKEIAKRLSKYVDEIFVNADEFYLNRSEDYWTDWEGLAWDSHFSFRHRIAKIAIEMRVEPEIEMMPILVQKYFNWKKENNLIEDIKFLSHPIMIKFNVDMCVEDSGLFLHEKTKKLLTKNIKSIIESGVTPIVAKEKETDRAIKKFILKNPRRYSITGTKKLQIGGVTEITKKFKARKSQF